MDDERCCGNCAFWDRLWVDNRGECGIEMPPWLTRGDDGDRTTHEGEGCSFHEFLEDA